MSGLSDAGNPGLVAVIAGIHVSWRQEFMDKAMDRLSTADCSMLGLQIAIEALQNLRGQVIALRAVAFLGMTPIGGPLVGYVAQHAGPGGRSGSAG